MLDTGMTTDEDGDFGVYGRITIPIGGPTRIDCSRLYEMELEKLRAELDQLRGESSGYVVE